MTYLDSRHEQTYPILSASQIEMALRFSSGGLRTFEPGETVYEVGSRNVPAWLLIEGAVKVVRRSGSGAEMPVFTYGPGQITGEMNQLSGRAALASGTAGEKGALAASFDAAHLRALIIGSADIGELLMRAFILRRVALIEAGREGSAGPVLLGRLAAPDLVRLTGFLAHNGHPHTVVAACQPEGRELVERLGLLPNDLPIMICPNGTVLKRPSNAEAAACLGLLPELDPQKFYDVAVVGAGPAGLATAVYGASEGLSIVVLDSRAYGGQAGASARIENYLGFPTGISGHALAGRAFTQATKFGADLAIPLEVETLHCHEQIAGGGFTLAVGKGEAVRARTVVVASGARYRRPNLPNLADFEDRGISYWASSIEAKLVEKQEVGVMGGGNSAGQAIVFLSPYVKTIHLIVRRPLQQTMSRYLVDRVAALPNVLLHEPNEIVALEGERTEGLTAAVLQNKITEETTRIPIRHLFLFIGAEPNTPWLGDYLATDTKGFVLTGEAAGSGSRLPLETSRPGIFAVGDVRAGSTKRVAAAVGEGAACIAQIHSVLAGRNSEPGS